MLTRFLGALALIVAVGACETSSSNGSGPGDGTEGTVEGVGTSTTTETLQPPTSGATIERQSLSPTEAQRELVSVGDRVFFDFDQFMLSPQARDTLLAQAELLRLAPSVNVLIEGHADERGTREYNLALGARRASAVRDFLIANGVSPARVDTVSYGEERPTAFGASEAAFAENRKAVTVITGAPAS